MKNVEVGEETVIIMFLCGFNELVAFYDQLLMVNKGYFLEYFVNDDTRKVKELSEKKITFEKNQVNFSHIIVDILIPIFQSWRSNKQINQFYEF